MLEFLAAAVSTTRKTFFSTLKQFEMCVYDYNNKHWKMWWRSANGRVVIRLCTIVRYSCALFFSVFHCGHLYFFMLHLFNIALFSVVTFSCCTFFRVALFLCIALFHVALLYVAYMLFLLYFSLLHPSHVAIFSCCTLFMLHYSRGVTRTAINI